MANSDYRSKYLEIRDKLIESTDVAYRLGFEDGMKEGEQAAQQAAQQAQQEAEIAAMGGMPPGEELPPGEEGMPPEMEGEEPMPEEMGEEEGSDLDTHINELESLVAKGEKPSLVQMRDKVEDILSLRKSQRETFKNKSAKTVSAQKTFVDKIIKNWSTEIKDTPKDIEDIIKESGIKIGE